MTPFVARAPMASDLNFIYQTWLKSHRLSSFASDLTNTVYYDNHKKIVERLVKTSKVLIVCSREEPNQIIGYIVYADIAGVPVIHYIYVKQIYRRMGIGSRLFEHSQLARDVAELPTIVTHTTKLFDILKSKWGLVYNPYILERSAAA